MKEALGWTAAKEVGKFYDDEGSDKWYYFVYGDGEGERSNKTKNEISELVCYKAVYGDIAVVRSGPTISKFEPSFSRDELSRAIEFHKTADRERIFVEREQSRFMRSMKLDHLPANVVYRNTTFRP